jgi:16S rRNA (guanine527-N7)-methyltransferase
MGHSPAPTLSKALSELALDLGPDARAQLLELAALVEAWGSRINLTGHQGLDGILRGLILEALALERVLPECETLLDIGSGAGFPGLPIAIVRAPHCRVTLLDSRQRRHHFQRAAIRALGLENVTPLLGRAEELDPIPHGVVVAQALAQPAAAIELMREWAGPGGWVALAVSEPPDLGVEERARLAHTEVRRYRVPISNRQRVLFLAQPAS